MAAELKRSKSKLRFIRRESLTLEESIVLSFRAKCRFKAAVRFVMQNIYWLDEMSEEDVGDNVLKNVYFLTRKKDKKSLLSIKEKAILNKPADERTEAEKLHIYSIIGSLKCFGRYPIKVRKQLAGVTYYVYYGPGRCIVRENDKAHALYFVVSGEVIISVNFFDHALNKLVRVEVATMGPGSMFGEVSLLHNIDRTATVHTATHCELLCLKKHDFNVVLKQSLQKEWDEIQTAMKLFTYFDEWDEVEIRECCIISRLQKYKPEEVILGDSAGAGDHAYFIAKGQCIVIEHIYIKTENKNNRKRYTIFEPIEPIAAPTKKTIKASQSVKEIITKVKTTVGNIASQSLTEISTAQLPDAKGLEIFAKLSRERRQIPTSKILPCKSTLFLPRGVKTHFMQICYLNETACFGLGENFKRRRIVAVTPTTCLLIPRYWILQKNKGNIWNKIVQFLNNKIPSTEEVFQEFLNHKKWLQFRKELVRDILRKKPVYTGNSIQNVPYSIRIKQ